MKYRRSITIFTLCLWSTLAIVSFGCGNGATPITQPAAETRTVKDGLGKDVALPERVERAISLAPSITEMVFAAGAGDRLVGVTSYCDFPAEAASIDKVGDTQSPNIERIISLQPDVVLVSTASQLEAFTSTLESQNIAVFVIATNSVDDVMADLVRLGEIFNTKGRAADLAASLQSRLEAVSKRDHGRASPRVFVQISKDPLVTVGRDSFITDAVSRAGGDSVTAAVSSGYPVLSKETALAYDPDIIVLSDSSDNREPNAVFAGSRAVGAGRVVRIDPDAISRPGPRLVDAIETLAKEFDRYR
ncbi:MAG TPA: cobalamin-binding protein [Pyrinomonadaceae bacterium]|nr:cobalamin-binding protein [Pyrinomonadaceae bacterium]